MKCHLFLVCILLLLCSCQKLFKEDEQNTLNLNNRDDLAMAIAGLNYRFGNSVAGVDGNNKLNQNMNTTFSISSINSDDVAFITDTYNFTCGMSFYVEDPTIINDIKSLYKYLYQTIICANDILTKSSNIDMNKPEIKMMIGEVYFLRAFTYFRLVRLFGQVPLIDNVNVSYTIKKASFNELYNFILSDLKNALVMLPASNKEARIMFVTPHRGTAKALLAEVYLTMAGYPLKQSEMYSLAASTAKEVIDSASFFGYALLPDFNDLWNGYHEKNVESVFSLYSKDFEGNSNYSIIYTTEIYQGLYFNTNYTEYSYVGLQFYNNFPDSYRKKLTYRVFKIFYANGAEYFDTTSLPAIAGYCSDLVFRKFYYPFNSLRLDDDKGRVIYLMRYAKTLLTYAEAKARSGNLDASAYEAINEIRRRANRLDLFTPSKFDLKSGLTADQFADSVVWERAFEFCAEPENRTFDLLRLEMMGQLPALKFPGQGQSSAVLVDPVTNFFPIPIEDMKLNPNLN